MSQQSFEKIWRSRFEKYAQLDTDAQIAGWSAHSLDTRVQVFQTYWQPKKQASEWIDIGCGAGTYTRYLIQQHQTVTAVDYSFPTLSKAKEKLKHQADYTVADVRFLPFKSNSFDGVLCFGVLQALHDPQPAINELIRMIKKNGEIWIDGLNRRSLRFLFEWARHHCLRKPYRLTYISPWETKKIFEQMHINRVETIWLPILPNRFKKFQHRANNLVNRIGRSLPWLAALVSHAFIIKVIQ